MSTSISDRHIQWDKFLKRWPLETLDSIKLSEYSKAGSADSFTYWLEAVTEDLGSSWGGSAFKFGVYSRKDQSDREDGAGKSYSLDYGWYSKYGPNYETAFECVRSIVVEIANAARNGDLEKIEKANLGPAVKWKIAFLYQDRANPTVLPVYSAKHIAAYLDQTSRTTLGQLQKSVMAKRGGTDVIVFGRDVWNMAEVKLSAQPQQISLPTISPLNQILYGPPGTGKTYSTIDETLKILDPDFFKNNENDRSALKSHFDSFVVSEMVRFVTFHQSFSYEDFVEGLRAITNDEKQLEYVVEPGVFKRICDDARTQDLQPDTGIRSNPRIWKISINGTGSSPTKDYCLSHGEARIGWGETGDLTDPFTPNSYFNSVGSGNQGTLGYFSNEIVPGDILLCIHSAEMIGAIGVVTGKYRYEEKTPKDVLDDYKHVLPVNWLYKDLKLSVFPLNDGKQFTLKTVYSIFRFTWGDLLAHLEQSGAKSTASLVPVEKRKPYVLIIDEINRGNISRIFGELITLIEPSKRAGMPEALSTVLPYSKKPFSIPSNLHVIATMNSTDRSLAGMDIALRRRFTFKEMLPSPELIDGIIVEGLDVGLLLRKLNERIEVLLDSDHCLGHAYFLPIKEERSIEKLAFIFEFQIIPLLKEYFFEDWVRIAWVLNDQNKPKEHSFVVEIPVNLRSLFGAKVPDNLQIENKRWRINADAFSKIESYRQILGVAE